MLSLIRQEEKETKAAKQNDNNCYSNVVPIGSRVRKSEKSQKNVLAAAKKLKW